MVRAPAPTGENAVRGSQRRRQAAGSKTLQLVPLVSVKVQSPTKRFKCHLCGGRCYLSTTTTGPFVPASRDTNKQRLRLLQAPPPIPTHRPGQTRPNPRPCLPHRGPGLSCLGPMCAPAGPTVAQGGSSMREEHLSAYCIPKYSFYSRQNIFNSAASHFVYSVSATQSKPAAKYTLR